MCEANVYIYRDGHEELLMEKVDRIIPGQDDSIMMENIFGERRIVAARIREMELVHHRIVLEEVKPAETRHHQEIWLEPDTQHGHFHAGEEVRLKIFKGYNMHPDLEYAWAELQVFLVNDGIKQPIAPHNHDGEFEISILQQLDGLVQVCAQELGPEAGYAVSLVEVGHHHHHGVKPVGLPLEIVPADYGHARLGENYEIMVLKEGQPLAGAEVLATYSSTKNPDYPHRMTTDAQGKARLFLTARGNYLFSVTDGTMTSTFTLIKSF
jgi:predicted RNA-binding protein